MQSIEITLINRGFSTLFNEHIVSLVLIDEQGKLCYSSQPDVDVHKWQPYEPGDPDCIPILHKIQAGVLIPEAFPKGTYRLGLWIRDGSKQLENDSRYAIRCANGDTEWWVSPDNRHGVNILTTIAYN